MKVLMVDDDEVLCQMTKEYFELEKIEIKFCHTGKSWPRLLKTYVFDVIILDLSLPEANGLTILNELVQKTDTPVLFLTAQGSDLDHIAALKLGAQDYVDKPCTPQVLIERLKKLLDKRGKNQTFKSGEIVQGLLRINLDSRKVFINNNEIKVTTTEFKMLSIFISNPDKAYSKNDLALEALGRKCGEFDRSVDAHIQKLRKKILAESNKIQINNVYGFGYRLIIDD